MILFMNLLLDLILIVFIDTDADKLCKIIYNIYVGTFKYNNWTKAKVWWKTILLN